MALIIPEPVTLDSIDIVYRFSEGEEQHHVVRKITMLSEEREHEGKTQDRLVITTEWKDRDDGDG